MDTYSYLAKFLARFMFLRKPHRSLAKLKSSHSFSFALFACIFISNEQIFINKNIEIKQSWLSSDQTETARALNKG